MAGDEAAGTAGEQKKYILMEEVAKHDKETDCWLTMYGKVWPHHWLQGKVLLDCLLLWSEHGDTSISSAEHARSRLRLLACAQKKKWNHSPRDASSCSR